MVNRVFACFLAALLVGCGGGSPANANVAGNWLITVYFQPSSYPLCRAELILAQSGNALTGTFIGGAGYFVLS
jgi:hypothetical protein